MSLVNAETSELSELEEAALRKAESIIEKGLHSFVAVGQALAEVRERRLYRHKFGTFEAYCDAKWNLSRRRAYQLVDAATITRQLSENNCSHLPSSEAQARELSGLAPEQAADVMRKAHDDTDGKVTAKAIKHARNVASTEEPVRPPAPPKYGGNRRKHLGVIEAMNNSLSGYAMAAKDITELDESVTREEAARLRSDLSKHISSLRKLNNLLEERTK